MKNELEQLNMETKTPSKGGKRLASKQDVANQRRRSTAADTLTRTKSNTRVKAATTERVVKEKPVIVDAAPRAKKAPVIADAAPARKSPPAVERARRTQAAIPVWAEEAERDIPSDTPKAQGKLRQVLHSWQDSEGAQSPFIGCYRSAVTKAKRTRRRWRQIVREKRARHFPESERVLIQMLLFAWGMLPTLGCAIREGTWGRRKRLINMFDGAQGWLEGRKVHPVAFFGAAGALAVITLFCSLYTVGTTVTYDGEVIGVVPSQVAAETARADLEQMTTRTLGRTYTIDDSKIQYSSGLLRRQDVVDGETIEEELSQEIGMVTSAYCLYVDGERIGSTPYEGAMEELLKQLKAGITDENTISCDFAEKVDIRQEYVSSDEVMNLGYLAETLYSTKTAEITYTVKGGDTWSQIANSHDLTSSELLELNPGYNINKLSIGEVLTLSASVPYLTMTVVERERYVADVPFEIEYTDSANLYKGDYKVTSAGVYGAADTVANVTYINGEETDRSILSSVTLENPVTEQRLSGTKERPTWLPTGSFRWPCSGRISSRFGYRNLSYSYASKNHKGIDISGSRGTPIYASDGGTVSYSGWMSGYGYLVQINHGNGYVTYYGHNSSLLVSVGQHVYKGQQIAKMGSTGNSTGNHCHFEVRYNGVAKNPLNYLP